MKIPIISIAVSTVLLLSGCGGNQPDPQMISNQLQVMAEDNIGAGIIRVFDYENVDFYEKNGSQYIIANYKLEYLISKDDLITEMNEPDPSSGILGEMLGAVVTEIYDVSLQEFKKGDIEEVKGQHLRVLKSKKGWLIDPDQQSRKQ